MKILSTGNPKWWIGLTPTCGYCRTVVEIEGDDCILPAVNIFNMELSHAEPNRVKCPVCGKDIFLSRAACQQREDV